MEDHNSSPIEPVPPVRTFLQRWEFRNKPLKIITLGHYYAKSQVGQAKSLLKGQNPQERNTDINARAVRDHIAWTRMINSLNAERQWPQKRFFEMLDPMLELGIALAVVPTHQAFQAFWPLRTLAQRLAETGRIDATSCLVRHTTIRRIVFGGPSTRALHRQTIQVKDAELIRGQRVLLLDDIAKSGASLIACREMLLEAGADVVQSVALGRVIIGE